MDGWSGTCCNGPHCLVLKFRFATYLNRLIQLSRTIPLIAVVIPSTLTVQTAGHPNETVIRLPVPLIEYDNLKKFAQWTMQGEKNPLTTYSGPSSRISRMVSAVASQGSILKINAPFPNCSYFADFYAPTLSCEDPLQGNFSRLSTFEDRVTSRIWNLSCPNERCTGGFVGYAGFVPVDADVKAKVDLGEEYALSGLNRTLHPEEPGFPKKNCR